MTPNDIRQGAEDDGRDGAGSDNARVEEGEGTPDIARLGSFSAAAIELGVTHGAVSRQVAALEAWFGHRLFVRAPRGLVLNGPGWPGDWADWLKAAGLGPVVGSRQIRFDHFFVTLQAATDGLGLAIGPFPVLDGDIASERFVRPFPLIRVRRASYYVLVLADADKTRALRSFVRWLKTEGHTAKP